MKFIDEKFRSVGWVKSELVYKSSGRKIPMLIRYIDNYNSEGIHTSHFVSLPNDIKMACDVSMYKGSKCITINYTSVRKYKSEIAELLNIDSKIIKGGNVSIVIESDSFDTFLSLSEKEVLPFIEKANALKKKKQDFENAQERVFRIYAFLDMGDYSSNTERAIKEYRIEDGKEIFVKNIASFWNSSFENHLDWKEDWSIDIEGKYQNYNEIISLELKEKWEERYQIHLKEKDSQKSEKEKKELQKKNDDKAKRQEKFDLAKSTGERVLLEQLFVSGDNVPKTYQHIEDNDMGHIQWYALPSGEVEETFSPSH